MRHLHTTFGPLAMGLALLAVPAAALAQPPEPTLTAGERVAVDGKRQALEQRAGQTVSAVLERLCPGRCELLRVEAEVEPPEVVGSVAPGFEPIGPSSGLVVEPKRLMVTILLDRKLPADFRANMPRLLEARLGKLAPIVRVRAETLSFPEPQLEPMPPLPPEPTLPQPQPWPPQPPLGPESLAEPVPPPSLAEEAARALLPWLGPIILALILAIAALVLLRRRERATEAAGAGARAGGDATANGATNASDTLDLDELPAVRRQLAASRALRNRVLRQWLLDDIDSVARAVELIGPEMFKDLRREPELGSLLEQLSAKVAAQTGRLTDHETQSLMAALRARLRAAQMADVDDLAADWGFLEGLSLGQLERLAAACTPAEHVFLLARLPESLRNGYLRRLDDDARHALVVAADDGLLSRSAAQELSSRLRRQAQEMVAVSDEHDAQVALLRSMLGSLDADRQVHTLRQIEKERPQVVAELLDRCVLEAAIPWLPDDVTADACHQSSVTDLASFCRQTTEPVREHLLSVLPGALAGSVRAEMALPQLGIHGNGHAHGNGVTRDALLARLYETLTRDGLEAGSINRQPLEQAAGADTPMESP